MFGQCKSLLSHLRLLQNLNLLSWRGWGTGPAPFRHSRVLSLVGLITNQQHKNKNRHLEYRVFPDSAHRSPTTQVPPPRKNIHVCGRKWSEFFWKIFTVPSLVEDIFFKKVKKKLFLKHECVNKDLKF